MSMEYNMLRKIMICGIIYSMIIGPKDLKEAQTLFGPCSAAAMIMILKKSQYDGEDSPISTLIMKRFIGEFNNKNYSKQRPKITFSSFSTGPNMIYTDIKYQLVGISSRQIESIKRISIEKYWLYNFEGFFVPHSGKWGNHQYDPIMINEALHYFNTSDNYNKFFLLRGIINRNKKSPHITDLEFHKIQLYTFKEIYEIINGHKTLPTWC